MFYIRFYIRNVYIRNNVLYKKVWGVDNHLVALWSTTVPRNTFYETFIKYFSFVKVFVDILYD